MSGTLQNACGYDQAELDVVLIDDDKLTIEIVSWILKNSGYSNRLFVNPQLAIEYLLKHTPRILIVDYYMPETNGYEFIVELQSRQMLEHTKLFLCSAVIPRNESAKELEHRGIQILEKQVVCDRLMLLELIKNNSQKSELARNIAQN